MTCNVCQEETAFFATAIVRQAHEAVFVRCPACGFVQIETPFWLEEAYSSALTHTDLGLVSRNLAFNKTAKAVIEVFFDRRGKFIDYGGGTGLFTRLMRDSGYDFYCYDRQCVNHFSDHFRVELDGNSKYELLTSVEVFEHLTEPLPAIKEMAKLSPNILFTTQLLPKPNPRIEDWWYYGIEHGQHISFYDIKTLEVLSRSLGFYLTSNGSNLHLFSERPVSPWSFRLVTNRFLAGTISLLLRRPSLLGADFLKVLNQEEEDDGNADCS